MTASTLAFRFGIVFAVLGMLMGIAMAAAQDHSVMPAHAHLNLLGWVSLFLFGFYYERRPQLDQSRLARLQVTIWAAATVVLTVAVAAIHLGHGEADPVAALASLVVLADTLLFGYLVYRDAPTRQGKGLAPAE